MASFNYQGSAQFKKDLEIGQQSEREFATLMENLGCTVTFNNSKSKEELKKYDLIVEMNGEGVMFEIKNDLRALDTGNVAVEFECINHSEAKYVVYKIGDTFYKLSRHECLNFFYKNYRIVSAYKTDNTIVLVPINDFKAKALCSINKDGEVIKAI